MSQKLFEEFPPVSTAAWMEAVAKDLKGGDFEKRLVKTSLDGLRLKPFYRAEDLPADLSVAVRGCRADGNVWRNREEVREDDLDEANLHILNALTKGADELAVYVYPMGPDVLTGSDLQRLLSGVWLEAVPLHWLAGPLSKPVLGLILAEADRRKQDRGQLQGSVEFDPVTDRCAGWTDADWGSLAGDLVEWVDFVGRELPQYQVLQVRGSLMEKAGASLAQELAFSLGVLAEMLSVLKPACEDGRVGISLEEVVRRTEVRLGVGTNYFLEIAKLRAWRVLVANLLDGFGVRGVRPQVHGVTTSSNKTLYDPMNNLLRATIESMACTIGGVDTLSVAAYDQGYGAPDEFSRHLARNTTILLREEAYLGRVADPLGGSYTVERLTHDAAEAAWGLFLDLEKRGGFVASWESGFVGSEIERVCEARSRSVNRRLRTIVGTTVYANLKEQRLGDVRARQPVRRARAVAEGILDLADRFGSGASLVEYLGDVAPPSTAFDPFRPSWPFEHLRLRVERSVVVGGKRPVILLAEVGDLTMRKARSGFCLGFFGAAGYEVLVETVGSGSEAVAAAVRAGADVLVLCSSDAEYAGVLREVSFAGPVVVAGLPENAEELKGLGATDFVHIRLDVLEALTGWHERLGVPLVPLDEPLDPRVSEVAR